MSGGNFFSVENAPSYFNGPRASWTRQCNLDFPGEIPPVKRHRPQHYRTEFGVEAPRGAKRSRREHRGAGLGVDMDQRYVDTVRACKVLLRNLHHLNESMTSGQRVEFARVAARVRDGLDDVLEAEHADEGLWIGEE